MSQQLPPGFMLIPDEDKKRKEDEARAARSVSPTLPLSMSLLNASMGGRGGRMVGLAARGMLQGPSSLIGLPLDAAVAAYNLATGQNIRQPSEAISQSLTNLGLPEPQGILETGVTAMAGGAPEARAKVTNLLSRELQRVSETPFMGQQNMQDLLLAEANNAGYVVPPATVGRKTVRENVSGKVMTQQAAAERNQQVTNRLAARALGLPEDRPLSPEAVLEVRRQAGTVYEKIKTDRRFSADDQYLNDLSAIEEDVIQISRDFPDLKIEGMKEVSDLVKGLTEENFSSKGLVNLVKDLRYKAKTNLGFGVQSPAQRSLGNAQMDAAEALEDLMERELIRKGDMTLLKDFRDARRLIAKSHSVENAINPSTGNVNAASLSNELQRRKPLTGDLATIARFGRAFPSAAQELKSSPVSAMDAAITTLLGTSLGSAPFLAGSTSPYAALSSLAALSYPGARYLSRESVLGPSMQRSLVRRDQGPRGGLLGPIAGATTTIGANRPAPTPPPPTLPAGFRVLEEDQMFEPNIDFSRIGSRPVR